MSFTANTLDSASHHVQVYSDVSGGTRSHSPKPVVSPQLRNRVDLRRSDAEHSLELDIRFFCHLPQCHAPGTGNIHRDTRPTGMGYTIFCHAEREFYGCWFTSLLSWSMVQGTKVSFQSGSDVYSRGNFTRNGFLNLQRDQNRSISDHSTVFALAYELYNITATQAPAVWAIGYTTDSPINYTDLSGAPPTYRGPYYKTRYSNDKEMVSIHSTRREHVSNTKADG